MHAPKSNRWNYHILVSQFVAKCDRTCSRGFKILGPAEVKNQNSLSTFKIDQFSIKISKKVKTLNRFQEKRNWSEIRFLSLPVSVSLIPSPRWHVFPSLTQKAQTLAWNASARWLPCKKKPMRKLVLYFTVLMKTLAHLLSFDFVPGMTKLWLGIVHVLRHLSMSADPRDLRMSCELGFESFIVIESKLFSWFQNAQFFCCPSFPNSNIHLVWAWEDVLVVECPRNRCQPLHSFRVVNITRVALRATAEA